MVAELGSGVVQTASQFIELVGAWSWILQSLIAYLLKVLQGIVWQFDSDRRASLVQRRLVAVVLSWPWDKAQNFGVLERSRELHFLNQASSTYLPLPNPNPFFSSFLNSEPSS